MSTLKPSGLNKKAYALFAARELALAISQFEKDADPTEQTLSSTLEGEYTRLVELIEQAHSDFNLMCAQKGQINPQERDQELECILASGIAFNIPTVKDKVMVVGCLLDKTAGKNTPFKEDGLINSDPPSMNFKSPIKFWILGTELLKHSATTLPLFEQDSDEKAQGVSRIVIRRSVLLDEEVMQMCDYTQSLNRLIHPEEQWIDPYRPVFQLYHPELDALLERKSKGPPLSSQEMPQKHPNFFTTDGATPCDLLVLPDILSLLGWMLSKSLSPDSPERLDEQATLYGILPDELKADLDDSIRRLALFLNPCPSRSDRAWSRQDSFKSIGKGVQAHYPTKTDEKGDPYHLLSAHEALGLNAEVMECLHLYLQATIEAAKESHATRMHAEQQRRKDLISAIHKNHEGHTLWVLLRVRIELALMAQRFSEISSLASTSARPIPITQRVNSLGEPRIQIPYSLDLQQTSPLPFIYGWLEPVLAAPVRSCRLVTTNETTKEELLHPCQRLDMSEKLTLVFNNRHDEFSKDDPLPMDGPYFPVSVYDNTEEGRKLARAEMESLEAVSGVRSGYFELFDIPLARPRQWLEFLNRTAFSVTMAMFEQKSCLGKSPEYRGDLFHRELRKI